MMHHELLRKHRKHPVSMLWPASSVVMTQTDVKLAAIGIGGGGRSAMVCRIERRWQGREAGTSQKGIILLREDSLSGAWTQNTKHEKKRHAINTKPKEQNTMLRSTSQWLRQRWQGRVTRKSQEGQGKGTEQGKRPGTDTRMRGRSTDYIICLGVGMRSIGSQPAGDRVFLCFCRRSFLN